METWCNKNDELIPVTIFEVGILYSTIGGSSEEEFFLDFGTTGLLSCKIRVFSINIRCVLFFSGWSKSDSNTTLTWDTDAELGRTTRAVAPRWLSTCTRVFSAK